MTHPEDLLAEYVDGSLSSQDRVVVEAHLASCPSCRDEAALARGAASALRSLPEVRAPAGVARVAIEEAGVAGAAAGSAPGAVVSLASRRYRFLAVAAAAAVVAVIAITLPRLGGTNSVADSGTGATAERNQNPALGAQGSKSLSVEIQQTDYTSTSAGELATSAAAQSLADTPVPIYAGASGSSDTRTALSCLSTAFPGFAGDPIRLIHARFQGKAAYIGLYTEGPGAGRPPDTVSVRVAAVDGCSLLTYTSAKI